MSERKKYTWHEIKMLGEYGTEEMYAVTNQMLGYIYKLHHAINHESLLDALPHLKEIHKEMNDFLCGPIIKCDKK